MNKKVVIIGGGIAGMEASITLAELGYHATLLEKSHSTGGHVQDWYQLFPNRRPAKEVLTFSELRMEGKVKTINDADIIEIEKNINDFRILLRNGKLVVADAIVVATGFDLFDAHRKEEYGYGIYENVITSADLEKRFSEGKKILTHGGAVPKRIGIIHCVGSRDEKSGNNYCSKVCCVTGVKQAIEIREMLPETEVFCFYMDLRMFGRHFEELYKESQEKWGVNFIRGRLSEANENADGSILLKVEDTLAGKPLKMKVDLLILLAGFVPSGGTKAIGKMLGLPFGDDGFITPKDEHTSTNLTDIQGVFVTGSCTGPKSIQDSIADARAAATQVANYLK